MTAQGEAKVLELLDRIAGAVERIAVGVERATTVEDPTPTACQHPPEFRIDFGGMQGADEWECSVRSGGCGFRFPRDVAAAKAATERE